MPKKKETREEALARLKREGAGQPLARRPAKPTPKPQQPVQSPASKAAQQRREAITKRVLPGMQKLADTLYQKPKKKKD